MPQCKNVIHAVAALAAFSIAQATCYALSTPVPLDPRAKNLIHISTRPRSAEHVFVKIKIEKSNPRSPDVRLKLSAIRLNVRQRKATGKYETIVSTGMNIWRKDGNVHAYFIINKKLIESSTLELVLDRPTDGEDYHVVQIKDFIKSDRIKAPGGKPK